MWLRMGHSPFPSEGEHRRARSRRVCFGVPRPPPSGACPRPGVDCPPRGCGPLRPQRGRACEPEDVRRLDGFGGGSCRQDSLQSAAIKAVDRPNEPFEPRPVACTILHSMAPGGRPVLLLPTSAHGQVGRLRRASGPAQFTRPGQRALPDGSAGRTPVSFPRPRGKSARVSAPAGSRRAESPAW